MRFIKRSLIGLVLTVVLLEAYQLATEDTSVTSSVANALFNNNLHEVTPGQLYRSAEMSSDELEKVVRRLGIKTVFDLRLTPKPIPKTAAPENEVLEKLGAHYVHFPIMGSQEPSPEQLQQLLKEMDHAEPPLLVHCSSGTHRSGVVSAIWMMDKEGVPYEIASQQLSAKFGFFYAERKFKSLIEGHPTVDNILWRYGKAKERKSQSFREWVDAGMPD